MSAARSTNRAFASVLRSIGSSSRKPFATVSDGPVRFACRPPLAPVPLCPLAVPRSRLSTKQMCEKRQLRRSTEARREFSASSRVAHGHVTAPKAGEEYVLRLFSRIGTKTD